MAGQKPTLTDVHVDAPLTNFVRRHGNRYALASMIPRIMTDNESDKYFSIAQSNFASYTDPVRAPGSRAQYASFQLETQSFKAKEYALYDVLPGRIMANADAPLNMPELMAANLSDLIQLEYERQCFSKLTTSGGYATGHSTAITAGSEWDVPTAGDPIGDIDTAKLAILQDCGALPPGSKLKLAMGPDSWIALKEHPDFVDRFKYVSAGPVTLEGAAMLLGIDEIVVCWATSGSVDAAGLPNPINNAFLWPSTTDTVALCVVAEGLGGQAPQVGSYTCWAAFSPYGLTVERWFDDTELGSAAGAAMFVRVSDYWDIKAVAVDTASDDNAIAGHIITNTLA